MNCQWSPLSSLSECAYKTADNMAHKTRGMISNNIIYLLALIELHDGTKFELSKWQKVDKSSLVYVSRDYSLGYFRKKVLWISA